MSKNKNKVGFKLNRIKTNQFATLAENYDAAVKEVAWSFKVGFGADMANKVIAVFVKVDFLQAGKTFMLLETTSEYNLNNELWETLPKDTNKLIIPLPLASHLAVLSVGTARGILHAKTENTEFNRFLLPTVDLTTRLKEDVEIELPQKS